jgi:hypothetical protein
MARLEASSHCFMHVHLREFSDANTKEVTFAFVKSSRRVLMRRESTKEPLDKGASLPQVYQHHIPSVDYIVHPGHHLVRAFSGWLL